MTDSASLPLDGETPVNPYSLLEAVNRSSDTAHMAWLVFLGIMTYIMIAVAGVTHKDLLLETPVSLPMLQVDIQLTQFFQFAPIVLVLFHLGLVSQLALLARKTLEFDQAIRLLETTDRRTHPLRLELHNFFFVQAMGGPHRSMVMGAILHAMSWLTLVILPVVLILYIQTVFLPYHSGWITWTHRFALLFDIGILLLVGMFLTRAETSFFQAFWRASTTSPTLFFMTTILLVLVTFFSFFVATVPGRMMDKFARSVIGMDAGKEVANDKKYYSGFVLPYLSIGDDGALFGIFLRNLVVTDQDLVVDKEVSAGEPTLSLRGRDLQFAKLDRSDMHQADFTGANLDHAKLRGTDLRDARLHCADVTELLLSEDRKRAQCTSARFADFSRAKLMSAEMTGIDASFAKFEEADLDGAQLPYGILTGTNFSSARLRYANMTGGIQAIGANFLIASLQGADLSGAKLFGADFGTAGLTAATLDHAHLEGANFQDASLEGASLEKTILRGANLSRAKIRGADLRGAAVWMTEPPLPDTQALADFSKLTISPPSKSELKELERLSKLDGKETGIAEQISDALTPLLKGGFKKDWAESDDGRVWEFMVAQNHDASGQAASAPAPSPVTDSNSSSPSGTGGPTMISDDDSNHGDTIAAAPVLSSNFGTRLTGYLSKLMCRAQWSDGSVARGVVRRALQPKFEGDMIEIDRRLQDSSCLSSEAMPKEVLRELAVAIDRKQDQ